MKNIWKGNLTIRKISITIFLIFLIILSSLNAYKGFINYIIVYTIDGIAFILLIIIYKNTFVKIILQKNVILIKYIFHMERIPFYKIIAIKDSYLILSNKIVILTIDDNFWIRLNELYYNYYNENINYFNRVKELHKEIFNIIEELYIDEQYEPGQHFYIHMNIIGPLLFFSFRAFLKFIGKYSIYSELWKNNKKLKKIIKEYKDNPNFS